MIVESCDGPPVGDSTMMEPPARPGSPQPHQPHGKHQSPGPPEPARPPSPPDRPGGWPGGDGAGGHGEPETPGLGEPEPGQKAPGTAPPGTPSAHPGAVTFTLYALQGRDPQKMMARYFDAFLYLANWGTRHLMFRLPQRAALDLKFAGQYCYTDAASLIETGDHLIISLYADRDPDDCWDEPAGELGGMVAARSELLSGDHRLL